VVIALPLLVPAIHQVIRPSPQLCTTQPDMEFENLLGPVMWMFNISAFFTEAARRGLMEDAARILVRVRHRRVRAGYRPNREEYLHQARCDVTFRVAAADAHLHPAAADFSYAPQLQELVGSLFKFETTHGYGMSSLAEFREKGEYCSIQEGLSTLHPIELEARGMVEALLEGLPKIFA
jgi:hypothetical protein